MSLYRNAHTGSGSPAMDDLGYWYEVEGGGDRWRAIPGTDDYELASNAGTPLDLAGIGALGLTLRNRLNHVTDAKGVAFTSDLGNQSPDNYAYNAVGELVSDAAEGLEVDWTAYHKVANVHYPGATGTQMQDIDFRYGPMQHRAEKTLRDAGNNLIKTTYYVHDASGNVMAIYEKAFNGGILETRLKACPECNRRELPIYGSDRLGLRLDDTPVKGIKVHHRLSPVLVYCEAVPNLEPGMLRVSELLYDSPIEPALRGAEGPPSSAEVNKGEYVTLRNTFGVPIPLRYVKLRVPSHGSYRPVLSHVEGFSSTDTLQPDHSILVAYGTGTDSTDLRLADNLPAGLFSDPTMHLRTQTSMTLPDAGGSLQLYEDVSGFETLLENISFGGSGILAANAYCDTTCQAILALSLAEGPRGPRCRRCN